jgi:CheY-like chemotaxis protein
MRFLLTDRDVTVLADPGQLEQVVMNLCTNARDAMPSGGKLVIATEVVEIKEETAIQADLVRGRYAVLSISDTGTGMDVRTRERIFEPFFTTKEMGRGTGLGLSIVYGIIKQHSGQIEVSSEAGRGTTFRTYLPLTGQAAEAAARREEASVRGGNETILVAEDNEEVLSLARFVLEESGYRVITAVDGEEAIRQFSSHRDEIALCLIDLIMPKRSGKDAVGEMRKARQGIKVVYMSGYTADIIRERDIAEVDAAFLSKPLLPQDLLRTVRDALDA